MSTPDPPLDAVHASHRRLADALAGLTDEQVRQPSPLPGWTRGHVATHVADNARAFARMTLAAFEGREVPMYDGGQEGRNASIERGARRSARDMLEDVKASSADVEEAWSRAGPDDWARPVSHPACGNVVGTVYARWRESEVHLVDLDAGVDCTGWSVEFCAHAVDFLLPRLPATPGVSLVPDDDAHRWVVGDGAGPLVRGRLCDITAWLAGRTPAGPVSPEGGELPDLGPWP